MIVALASAAGPAHAGSMSVTIADTTLRLSASNPFELVTRNRELEVRARWLPKIWIGVSVVPYPADPRMPAFDAPIGYVTKPDPAQGAPPSDEPWTVFVQGDHVTLQVRIARFVQTDRYAAAYVHQILRSIIRSIRPPFEIAPGMVLDRTEHPQLIRRGAHPNELVVDATIVEVSFDHVSCLDVSLENEQSRCVELPDRALLLTPRAAEWDADDDRFQRPKPLDTALVANLSAIARRVYGTARVPDTAFRPGWANGEIPIHRIPFDRWKLSTRGDDFQLFGIDSGTRIVVKRARCDAFWNAPPDGARIESPAFFPSHARAAITGALGPSHALERRHPRELARAGWVATSCFDLLGRDVAVSIEAAGPPTPTQARALAGALTEIQDATRVAYTMAGIKSAGGGGMAGEMWFVGGRASALLQLELIHPGAHDVDELAAARFAIAGGLGVSRPRLRAGIHFGLGLERAPMRVRAGEDHAGGSLFVDARSAARVGPIVVQGIARGTLYSDLDCEPAETDGQGFCADRLPHSSDFTPRAGLETELRIGATPRRGGWLTGGFLGVRHIATWGRAGVEHHNLVSVGLMVW